MEMCEGRRRSVLGMRRGRRRRVLRREERRRVKLTTEDCSDRLKDGHGCFGRKDEGGWVIRV